MDAAQFSSAGEGTKGQRTQNVGRARLRAHDGQDPGARLNDERPRSGWKRDSCSVGLLLKARRGGDAPFSDWSASL